MHDEFNLIYESLIFFDWKRINSNCLTVVSCDAIDVNRQLSVESRTFLSGGTQSGHSHAAHTQHSVNQSVGTYGTRPVTQLVPITAHLFNARLMSCYSVH